MTPIHDRLPVEHFVETQHTYFARCSCGWVGRGFYKEATAIAAYDAHVETHALGRGRRPVSLLGTIPELDDIDEHVPVEHGTLTRCEVDGQLYPCSTIERARQLEGVDVSLLELIDVGWTVWTRSPVQLDPRPVGGIVAGYTDDEEAGRVYTVLDWKHGRPIIRKIAARDVDPQLAGLPNSRSRIAAYRQLCRHVGQQTGSADGTEVRDIAMALALAQATT